MKMHNDIIQGSDEWLQLRSGIPTASSFDKIITPTGKQSAQADGYANLLIAELITGKPEEIWRGNMWSERGKVLEPDAVLLYEMQTDRKTDIVGFVTRAGMGCSPDRLIGDDGLLEIKSPAPHTHVEYLLKNTIDPGYIPQVQGQMYVTGRKWVDWYSYYPELPPVIIRVERDEAYLEKLAQYMADFFTLLESKKARLIELGYIS